MENKGEAMATIDIRDLPEEEEEDPTIIFGTKENTDGTAIPYKIEYNGSFVIITTGVIGIKETYVCVRKGDVSNLIKALEKAVEFGWDK